MAHKSIENLLQHFHQCDKCQKQPGTFCKTGAELLTALESAKHPVTERWLQSLGVITEGQRILLNRFCAGANWLNKSIPVQAANHIEKLTAYRPADTHPAI